MTRFREGDVVRCRTYRGVPYAEEGRVHVVIDVDRIGVVYPDDPTSPALYSASEVTLLRRPVRVGDRVTWGTRSSTYEVAAILEGGVELVSLGPDHPSFIEWRGNECGPLVHADGTPIDPPRSSTSTTKSPHPIRPNDILRAAGSSVTIVNGRGDREIVRVGLAGRVRWSVGPERALPPVLSDWEHGDGTPIERPKAPANVRLALYARKVEELLTFSPAPMSAPRCTRPCATCGAPNVVPEVHRCAGPSAAKPDDVAVQSGPAPVVTVVGSELSAEQLARGLFDTDPEVLAVVLPQADATLVPIRGSSTSLRNEGRPCSVSWRVEKVEQKRVRRALDRAWARGIFGYAPEAAIAARSWARAEAVVAAMRGPR